MNDIKDIQLEVAKLQMSPAVQKILQLMKISEVEEAIEDDIKSLMATCFKDMVDALDGKKIHFDNREDAAIFHALLGLVLVHVMGENLEMERAVLS